MEYANSVLVVEDSKEVRALLVSQLSARGFNVSEAEDGWSALKTLLEHGPVDLVLSDYQMQKLNGLELYQLISEAGLKMPFVLMSGSSELNEAEIGSLGIFAFLRKPFTTRTLLDTFRSALAGKEPKAI